MGISIRAYSRYRGVSDTAVRKAIKVGRIIPEVDGTIDPSKADIEWDDNTSKNLAKPIAGDSGSSTTFTKARTANEVLKAEANKLKLKQLRGELISKDDAITHVFKLARNERDAWVSWPARVSSQMAAELEVDTHKLHIVLENYIREHLKELPEVVVGF